jgi:EEF1A N-terminal glycine/lysine methyltransferase
MYPSRITAPLPPEPESEDIFSAALSILFTDDVQNSHGVPGAHVTYHSPRYGEIELRIPKHPDVEEGRKLFAHYLWNAGVICADALEEASRDEGDDRDDVPPRKVDKATERTKEGHTSWDKQYWDVRGKRVLELGAGT